MNRSHKPGLRNIPPFLLLLPGQLFIFREDEYGRIDEEKMGGYSGGGMKVISSIESHKVTEKIICRLKLALYTERPLSLVAITSF